MEEETLTNGTEPGIKPPARPNLLTILCILTFINGLLTFISGVVTSIFYDQIIATAPQIVKVFNSSGLNEMMQKFVDMLDEGGRMFFIVSSLLMIVSVAGAVMMWNLKKNGFHVYTIAQILLIIAPMYFFHLPGPSIFDIILSGTFIILYSTHLKLMT